MCSWRTGNLESSGRKANQPSLDWISPARVEGVSALCLPPEGSRRLVRFRPDPNTSLVHNHDRHRRHPHCPLLHVSTTARLSSLMPSTFATGRLSKRRAESQGHNCDGRTLCSSASTESPTRHRQAEDQQCMIGATTTQPNISLPPHSHPRGGTGRSTSQ
ncbi:hypothetical protein LY76DRAFT_112300 [Colletotrichum caudatum]|nr:hypothetical protein LY76DRAFT_112300 [Colletotrichum caudatum]